MSGMSSVTSPSSFTDNIRETGADWEHVAARWKHWRSNHGIPKSTSSGSRRPQEYAEQNCRRMNHSQWELGCSQLWNREAAVNDWFWSNLVGGENVDVYLGKDSHNGFFHFFLLILSTSFFHLLSRLWIPYTLVLHVIIFYIILKHNTGPYSSYHAIKYQTYQNKTKQNRDRDNSWGCIETSSIHKPSYQQLSLLLNYCILHWAKSQSSVLKQSFTAKLQTWSVFVLFMGE